MATLTVDKVEQGYTVDGDSEEHIDKVFQTYTIGQSTSESHVDSVMMFYTVSAVSGGSDLIGKERLPLQGGTIRVARKYEGF